MMKMMIVGLIAVSAPVSAQIVPPVPISDARSFGATLGTDMSDFYKNPALATAAGNTNPLFTLTRGSSLRFGIGVNGTFPDTMTIQFGGNFFTTDLPTVNGFFSYPINSRGGNSYFAVLTFDQVGSFSGTIQTNLLVATPDYAPDFNPATSTTGGAPLREAPTFNFRVQVLDAAGAVPEPGSWALMVVGFGAAGATMRRRRSPTTRIGAAA